MLLTQWCLSVAYIAHVAAALMSCGGSSQESVKDEADNSQPVQTGANIVEELEPLRAYIGTWEFEWDRAQTAVFGPAGKITGTETYEWLPGGYFVQMHREAKGPTGDFRTLMVFGYDRATSGFTAQFFGLHDGITGTATIAAEGNTRRWAATAHAWDGSRIHERCNRILALDGGSMMLSCEMSVDGHSWVPIVEGKYVKVR